MRTVVLDQPDDFEAWRDAARSLTVSRVQPGNVVWQVGSASDLFASNPIPHSSAGALCVPRDFIGLAKSVVCHRDPERFSILYALLHRLQSNRRVIDDRVDPMVRRLDEMAKAVRRDVHKMRAFVRFREVDGRFVAWFEPDHHIVRMNAAFFISRFANMQWSILTPEISIHWNGETLSESGGATRTDAPSGDPIEDVWKTYYASIFNPARVKISAMTKEMPKKYWKNMPETALVPGLIAAAQAREAAMITQARQTATVGADGKVAWYALREEAIACKRCDLHKCATQMVFGEGPVDAEIMFVGEQPGDQEDQAGRPFVGPAGQVFDRALIAAGIDRAHTYVTNAVKHFKFEQRGKRRIHAKPNAGEIQTCHWWIDQERAIVTPKITVALGATAARSLFGKNMTVGPSRSTPLTLPGGGEAWVTVHPSYLLRIDDKAMAEVEYRRFVEDLTMIRKRLGGPEQ